MKQSIIFQCVKLAYLKQDQQMFQTIQYKFNSLQAFMNYIHYNFIKVMSLQGNCELVEGKREKRLTHVERAGIKNITGKLKNKNVNWGKILLFIQKANCDLHFQTVNLHFKNRTR